MSALKLVSPKVAADGPAFEQIINSSDWDPAEPVTSSNKAILINMFLYEEPVVRRGKKVEAIRESLKALSFTRHFGKDAISHFLGKPEVLDCRRLVNLVKWKESDDSKITRVSKWFRSYITELNETMAYDENMLRKLLKF